MIGQLQPTGGCAPVVGTDFTVISGTGTILHYVPYSAYYNYSMGIWLMTASELGSAKQFTGLQLSKAYTEPAGVTQLNQTIKIYHTTATILPSTVNTLGTFGSTSTLVGANAGLPVSDETTVLDGSWYQTAAAGWKNLNFTTNFCYDGSSNVVIMWVNNDGAYTFDYPYWDTDSTTSSSQRGAWDYDDYTEPTSVGRANVRPHLKLNY
jgi:hypothetical protein